MKNKAAIVGVATLALLLAGCQNTENSATEESEAVEKNSQSESTSVDDQVPETQVTEDADKNSDQNSSNEDANEKTDKDASKSDAEKEPENESTDSKADTYSDTQATANYYIGSYLYDETYETLTAFSIEREENQDLSSAERLEISLVENDPSIQEILGSFTDITVEWPVLYVDFKEEGNQLSTTSALSTMFYDSLFGISDLYGIEEIVFSNPSGENSITVAERLVDEPIKIKDKQERGLSRGYYTIYNKELEQTLFLSGGQLEEPVENENGEPLTFPETVEVMGTVEKESALYSSAIVEGLEVGSASFENGVAAVAYTMDEEIATEADRTVFENAIQLAALDFHAEEVRLINNTTQEITAYPLIGQ